MLKDREQQLIDISRDCIGLWQGSYIAKSYRGTVKFRKPTWTKWFDGIVIRAKIVGTKVTYDHRELDRAKTDRVFFIDLETEQYAWGSLSNFKRKSADTHVSTFNFDTVAKDKHYGLRHIPQGIIEKYKKESVTTVESSRECTGAVARAKLMRRIMNNG